jgi:hypothetical protein
MPALSCAWVRACVRGCVCVWGRVYGIERVQFSRRGYADSLVLQVCGSLLLMDVWAIAQTECDVRVVRLTEAMRSGPTVCPYRGGEAT